LTDFDVSLWQGMFAPHATLKDCPRPMTVRQMHRLLKFWVAEAGLDPNKYGTESLRRTKALHVLNGTGDLETVRVLLGHEKIESAAHYLRIAKKSDPIAISRAFDI
jgi:site-specific recombinase XerD